MADQELQNEENLKVMLSDDNDAFIRKIMNVTGNSARRIVNNILAQCAEYECQEGMANQKEIVIPSTNGQPALRLRTKKTVKLVVRRTL